MTNIVKVVRNGKNEISGESRCFRRTDDKTPWTRKEKGDVTIVLKEKLGKFRNVFTQEQENYIVEHCLCMGTGHLA
jgi:hypothetical protein